MTEFVDVAELADFRFRTRHTPWVVTAMPKTQQMRAANKRAEKNILKRGVVPPTLVGCHRMCPHLAIIHRGSDFGYRGVVPTADAKGLAGNGDFGHANVPWKLFIALLWGVVGKNTEECFRCRSVARHWPLSPLAAAAIEAPVHGLLACHCYCCWCSRTVRE